MCPCCCRREQASCPLFGVRSARLLSVTLLWDCHRQAISCTFVLEIDLPYFITIFARFSIFLYYFLSTYTVHVFRIMWKGTSCLFFAGLDSLPYIQNLWKQCSSSVTFWYGSGFSEFFCLLLFDYTLTSFFKGKKLHKTLEIKFFSQFLLDGIRIRILISE